MRIMLLFAGILLILSSCKEDDSISRLFEIHEVHGRRSIKVTRSNLIKLHRLNQQQFDQLAKELDLNKLPSENGFSYFPPFPMDSADHDFQFLGFYPDNEVISVGWTSFVEQEDHFSEFKSQNSDHFLAGRGFYMFQLKEYGYMMYLEENTPLMKTIRVSGGKIGLPPGKG